VQVRSGRGGLIGQGWEARAGKVILYSHSGEVGDNDAVVGYAGMVFS
jgi:predicted class III extradiol MEMO1 family dioxygenase